MFIFVCSEGCSRCRKDGPDSKGLHKGPKGGEGTSKKNGKSAEDQVDKKVKKVEVSGKREKKNADIGEKRKASTARKTPPMTRRTRRRRKTRRKSEWGAAMLGGGDIGYHLLGFKLFGLVF